jgi:hypothetical protein
MPRDSFSLLVKAALSGARMVHAVALVRLAARPEACTKTAAAAAAASVAAAAEAAAE